MPEDEKQPPQGSFPVTSYPAFLGYTVYQAEYDELKEQLDTVKRQKNEMYDDLHARIKKRDELITKLANDLQVANEKLQERS
jgi:hypothetical protein